MKRKVWGLSDQYCAQRRQLVLAGLSMPVLGLCLAPLAHGQVALWTPPRQLKFDYSLNGKWVGNVSGTGSLNWNYAPQSGAYVMELSISSFLMSFFYSSQGRYDKEVGVLPGTYREKRIGRDRSVAFNYDKGTLSYSWKKATDTRPLQAGAQDAISVLMQMIHQMRNGVKTLQGGEQLSFPIARMGSVKNWSFSVEGQARTQVGGKSYDTWHIKWISPKDDEKTVVDMWLAPSLSYMPVKLKYWAQNGNEMDILLNKIRAFEA